MAKKRTNADIIADMQRVYGSPQPDYQAAARNAVRAPRGAALMGAPSRVKMLGAGYQPTAVEQEVQKVFGLEPGIHRSGLLPFARNEATDQIELTAPQALYDAARAFVAPSVALQGKPMDMQSEAQNFAVNFTGAGAPRGLAARPLEGGAVELGMSGGRRTFTEDEIARAAAAARAAYKGEASSFGVPLLRPGVEPISSQAARHGPPLDTPEMFYAQHGQAGYHGIVPPTRAEEVSFTTRPTVDIPPKQIATPENLEGKWVMGLPGDKKVAGVELIDVQGKPLSEAVSLHGGPGYTGEQAARGTDLGWNNQEEAAKPMRGMLQRIMEAGGDPYGMVVSMGPHAHDQTMGMAKVLSNLMPSAEVTKSGLEAFNDMIRAGYGAGKKPIAGIPDFPGIESPDFVNFVRGLPMPIRANITKAMDSAAAYKSGFPEIGAVRAAMIQPELLHAPSGSAGSGLVKFGPESLERVADAPDFSVSSYNSPTRRAAGSVPMAMDMLYPLELTHPDFFAARRAKGAAPSSDFRSFTLQPVAQEYRPEVVDALMRYREAVKRRRGD